MIITNVIDNDVVEELLVDEAAEHHDHGFSDIDSCMSTDEE